VPRPKVGGHANAETSLRSGNVAYSCSQSFKCPMTRHRVDAFQGRARGRRFHDRAARPDGRTVLSISPRPSAMNGTLRRFALVVLALAATLVVGAFPALAASPPSDALPAAITASPSQAEPLPDMFYASAAIPSDKTQRMAPGTTGQPEELGPIFARTAARFEGHWPRHCA
jgi:hypothetical protein